MLIVGLLLVGPAVHRRDVHVLPVPPARPLGALDASPPTRFTCPMAELPTGTVTFLFTDIEGSTKLLHELGDGYADVLAEHRRILRDAFAAHDGVEVDTQGDAFFVAFARATDAVDAAADSQRGLAEGPVRVRMGIHTGEPIRTDEGYVGIDVHRRRGSQPPGTAVRCSLSQATREHRGRAVDLRDLGAHRLKDLLARPSTSSSSATRGLSAAQVALPDEPAASSRARSSAASASSAERRAAPRSDTGWSRSSGRVDPERRDLRSRSRLTRWTSFRTASSGCLSQAVSDPGHVLPAISQAARSTEWPGRVPAGPQDAPARARQPGARPRVGWRR